MSNPKPMASPLKRAVLWALVQSPIVLCITLVSMVNTEMGDFINPFTEKWMRWIRIDHRYIYGSGAAALSTVVLFGLLLPIAARKAADKAKGVSGYSFLVLTTLLYAFPMMGVTFQLGSDLQRMYDAWQNPGLLSDFFHQLETNMLIGYALGIAVLVVLEVILIRKKPKGSAMQIACKIAGAVASLYLCLGLLRLALPTLMPSTFRPMHNNEYVLIGFGAGLLSLAVGLGWVLAAIRRNRALNTAKACSKCGYDLTGLNDLCPECGTAITPQTS